MKHSETLSKFAAAFAKAQTEFKNPTKNKTVKVATRSGSEYSYSYADLAPILEELRPLLNKSEISIMQGGSKVIETLLMHSSGEWVLFETDMDVFESGGKMNNVQEFGATMTYGRRYAVSAALGVAADEDNDVSKIPPKTTEAPKTVSKPTPTTNGDVCNKCGAELVLNPKTGKMFCKDKCWLKPSVPLDETPIQKSEPSEDDYMEALTNS